MDSANELYNDILRLVEEEVYQRHQINGYNDFKTNDDLNQTGGGSNDFFDYTPGKFEAIRHSMELPLETALRGTIARQKLFAKEQY